MGIQQQLMKLLSVAVQIDEFLTMGKIAELEEAEKPAVADQTPQGDAKMAAAFL